MTIVAVVYCVEHERQGQILIDPETGDWVLNYDNGDHAEGVDEIDTEDVNCRVADCDEDVYWWRT